MGQQSMDKPPAEAKPSAFGAEANELDQRLRQLISDYAALFLRHPNVEGRPSVEVYEKMRVLAAIRVHPWRKKLSSLANKLQREAFGEVDRGDRVSRRAALRRRRARSYRTGRRYRAGSDCAGRDRDHACGPSDPLPALSVTP
jgi:hypothetical protein